MSSEAYHEPLELLTEPTKNMHRAIVSLCEELEAIDWYQQRAEACSDEALQAVLLHNKEEEIEHAMMNLEWIRRNSTEFDQHIRTYLMKEAPITEIEGAASEAEVVGSGGAAASAPSKPMGGSSGSLGIGSLKGT